ncbi:hypothetical protein GCM10028803_00330 [Larkinella knui]|uniref:Uncharacterized protein n=1 Tax=Larkinella knui TaxID=2025310 RepID=A0A3P1CJR9_9BACT|nr:hypothetical protein EHT87_14280 [Larkinella knui]
MITKEQLINSFGRPVTITQGEAVISGRIYPLSGLQIEGYLSSNSEEAYIQVDGEDPTRPKTFPLAAIEFV